MKKLMKTLAIIFAVGCVISTITYAKLKSEILFSLTVTFGTFAYHFIMRLIVGYIINATYHNRMNYQRKWFQQKPWEPKVHKKLNVKKWKDRMPTYDAETFSMKIHSMEEIVMAMCQSEIVHEVIILFSFVPVTFSIWFDSFFVFLITSVLAAGFDLMFVIMQRYNRPRLAKILEKMEGK